MRALLLFLCTLSMYVRADVFDSQLMDTLKIQDGSTDIYVVVDGHLLGSDFNGYAMVFAQPPLDNLGGELIVRYKDKELKYSIKGEKPKSSEDYFTDRAKLLAHLMTKLNEFASSTGTKGVDKFIYSKNGRLGCGGETLEFRYLVKTEQYEHPLYGAMQVATRAELFSNDINIFSTDYSSDSKKYISSKVAYVGATTSCRNGFVVIKNTFLGYEKKPVDTFEVSFFKIQSSRK